MLKNPILLSCTALVLLAARWWAIMYLDRIAEMRAKFIRVQARTAARLPNNL
jgi:hypothetical protein